MPRKDGELAAIWALIALLAVSVLFNIAGLASASRYFVQTQKQDNKTTGSYCDAKLRAIGYKESTSDDEKDRQEEQKRRLDVCLQTRSAEAAEDAAKYARRQYWATIITLALAFVGTLAAAAATRFTWKQAEAAWDAVGVTKNALELEHQPIIQFTGVANKVITGRKPNDVILINCTVENIGNTHASNVEIVGHVVAFREIDALLESRETTNVHTSKTFRISSLPPCANVAAKSQFTVVFLEFFRDINETLLGLDIDSPVELLFVVIAKYEDRIDPHCLRVSEAHFSGSLSGDGRMDWMPVDGGLKTIKKAKQAQR